MIFEMRLARGDVRKGKVTPWPLADAEGRQIGVIHALRFDGEYTWARIELESQAEKDRLLRRLEEEWLKSQKLKEEYFKAFRGGH